jgi:D-alanyl-D-alanine carboxypeptidase
MSGGLEGWVRGVKPDKIIKSASSSHDSGKSGRHGHAALNTGYGRSAGFNQVTSVERNGNQIIAVILGENSARARDHRIAGQVMAYMGRMN